MPTRALIPFAVLLSLLGACSRRGAETTPPGYGEAVTAFYVGLSAMQTTQEVLAREKFDRVVALVPQEPAGWANLGLLLLRQQDLEQGAQRLARAAALAPDSAAIQRLQALAESRRGNLAAAITHWRRALSSIPRTRRPPTRWRSRSSGRGARRTRPRPSACSSSWSRRRENLAARLEYLRIAAKRGDSAALNAGLAPLTAAASAWSPQAQEQLKTLHRRGRRRHPRGGASRRVPEERPAARAGLSERALPRSPAPAAKSGEPIARFLRLKNPEPAAGARR